MVDFTSGYIQRALALHPKQGSKPPWKLYQNYALDLVSLRFSRLRDAAMVFSLLGNRQPASSSLDPERPGRRRCR